MALGANGLKFQFGFERCKNGVEDYFGTSLCLAANEMPVRACLMFWRFSDLFKARRFFDLFKGSACLHVELMDLFNIKSL
ncbi:unnamed protein product [Urochloa humidicola]